MQPTTISGIIDALLERGSFDVADIGTFFPGHANGKVKVHDRYRAAAHLAMVMVEFGLIESAGPGTGSLFRVKKIKALPTPAERRGAMEALKKEGYLK